MSIRAHTQLNLKRKLKRASYLREAETWIVVAVPWQPHHKFFGSNRQIQIQVICLEKHTHTHTTLKRLFECFFFHQYISLHAKWTRYRQEFEVTEHLPLQHSRPWFGSVHHTTSQTPGRRIWQWLRNRSSACRCILETRQRRRRPGRGRGNDTEEDTLTKPKVIGVFLRTSEGFPKIFHK